MVSWHLHHFEKASGLATGCLTTYLWKPYAPTALNKDNGCVLGAVLLRGRLGIAGNIRGLWQSKLVTNYLDGQQKSMSGSLDYVI